MIEYASVVVTCPVSCSQRFESCVGCAPQELLDDWQRNCSCFIHDQQLGLGNRKLEDQFTFKEFMLWSFWVGCYFEDFRFNILIYFGEVFMLAFGNFRGGSLVSVGFPCLWSVVRRATNISRIFHGELRHPQNQKTPLNLHRLTYDQYRLCQVLPVGRIDVLHCLPVVLHGGALCLMRQTKHKLTRTQRIVLEDVHSHQCLAARSMGHPEAPKTNNQTCPLDPFTMLVLVGMPYIHQVNQQGKQKTPAFDPQEPFKAFLSILNRVRREQHS